MLFPVLQNARSCARPAKARLAVYSRDGGMQTSCGETHCCNCEQCALCVQVLHKSSYSSSDRVVIQVATKKRERSPQNKQTTQQTKHHPNKTRRKQPGKQLVRSGRHGENNCEQCAKVEPSISFMSVRDRSRSATAGSAQQYLLPGNNMRASICLGWQGHILSVPC